MNLAKRNHSRHRDRVAPRSAAVLVVLVLGAVSALARADDSAKPPAVKENADPLRPPAIEAREVPAIAPAVFQRLTQYRNTRSAAFGGWAPSGKGILIRTRFGNSSQLCRVFEPGGRRQQITFFDEPAGGTFIPKSKDDALLLSMSRGGSENNQIYYLDPREHRIERLTDGRSRNNLNTFRPDGERVIISSNRRNGRDTDLYSADPRKPGSMRLILPTKQEYWYAADWSPDGKTLLLGRFVSANESYFATFDLENQKRQDIPLPGNKKAAIGAMALAPDGESILLSTDAGGEFLRLARYDLKTKKYKWLSSDIPWNVTDIAVSKPGNAAAVTVNVNGASQIYLLEGDKLRRLPLPLGIVNNLEFSPNGGELGFTLSLPTAPSDAYSINLSDGKLTRWTYSEVGGLNPDKFIAPEQIKFKSFDGREIPAYYYRPPGATAKKKAPVIVRIHGGPESQYRPYFSSITQYYLLEMGAAVIAPNVRGSSGYGKTYLTLDNGLRRKDSVRDIGALLDWIEKQPELDSSRVAVVGGSYGGYMVLASLIDYGDRLKAGIDIVGIANFITFLENTAPYRRHLRRPEYGDERDPEIRKFFERINPTANADKIRAALLVAHGKNDPRVPFSEAQQIARKVREQGRPVWTVFAENEGHGFGKKNNRDYLQAVVVTFLERHLETGRQPAAD